MSELSSPDIDGLKVKLGSFSKDELIEELIGALARAAELAQPATPTGGEAQKQASDAPVWYSAEAANGWASGYNSAIAARSSAGTEDAIYSAVLRELETKRLMPTSTTLALAITNAVLALIPNVAQAKSEPPPLEVWNGDRKVTVYEKEVMRIWGPDMEDEMSSDMRDHETVAAAFDWLYADGPALSSTHVAAQPSRIERVDASLATQLRRALERNGKMVSALKEARDALMVSEGPCNFAPQIKMVNDAITGNDAEEDNAKA